MTVHIDSLNDIRPVIDGLRTMRARLPSEELGTARAVTMNFIVYVDSPSVRDWVRKRAVAVADQHPSRLIVIDGCDDGRQSAELSSSCRETRTRTVHNERIELAVGSLDARLLASLLQELRLSDVPTVLWWAANRMSSDRRFDELAAQSTTVVVDSSVCSRTADSLRDLADVVRKRRKPIHDLAYLRLDPWREMVAQFFDDPHAADDVSEITSLEIESGSEAEGLYLAAWLAARLGWTPSAPRSFRSRTSLTIAFNHRVHGEQRRLRRILLATNGSLYRAEVTDDDANVVSLSVSGTRRRTPWLVPLQRIDNVSLLERAILLPTMNTTFFDSLAIAARIGTV